MTRYHSRFDRQRRLIERCCRFLADLNRQSDALYYPVGREDVPRRRGSAAQKQYDRAKRMIGDMKKELAR
jgi:hypothetical protein